MKHSQHQRHVQYLILDLFAVIYKVSHRVTVLPKKQIDTTFVPTKKYVILTCYMSNC